LAKIKMDDSIDREFLAKQTPGFSGADIANVCNEAALIAARNSHESVNKQDFLDAVDRIIGGLEKKNKAIKPSEKRRVAFHEAGHATISWLVEHAAPLLKVTIVPRGRSLGAAWYLPEERQLTTTQQMLDEICATLGGRAAEEIFFGKISTGASNDLQQITRIAYSMVTAYGMNSKVGNVSYYDPSQENTFTKPYSEETGKIIDHEVRGIIEEAYQRTLQLLRDKKEAVEILAKELLAKEVLHKSDVEILIGKRPFEEKKVVEVEVVPEVAIEQTAPEAAAPEAPAALDEQSSTEESI
jgi:cell division protease FtsH